MPLFYYARQSSLATKEGAKLWHCAYFLLISFCCSNCLSKFVARILLIPNILKYMSLKIVVLAKQVPDTRNVGKDAMNADGTINRAALPAIFNPEDLNALEQALRLKDTHPGSTVTILTMGPGRAAEIIREGLYRGADNGYLLTDRAFAGADTLATSYAIATAIRKIGECDLIIGGRQAIDGAHQSPPDRGWPDYRQQNLPAVWSGPPRSPH